MHLYTKGDILEEWNKSFKLFAVDKEYLEEKTVMVKKRKNYGDPCAKPWEEDDKDYNQAITLYDGSRDYTAINKEDGTRLDPSASVGRVENETSRVQNAVPLRLFFRVLRRGPKP